MQCRDATERMADLLFGQLPPEARQELEEHFDACEACADERATMAGALGALRRFADAESTHPVTPTDLEAITDMAALVHPSRGSGTSGSRGGVTASPWRRVARAAALVLATLGLASLFAAKVTVADGRVTLAFGWPGSTEPAGTPWVADRGDGAVDGQLADDQPLDLWEQHSLAVSNGDALVGAPPPAMRLMVQQAVQDALGPALRELVLWLATNEARRTEELTARERSQAEFLFGQLAATRNDIRTTRDTTQALYEVVSDAPLLRPDDR